MTMPVVPWPDLGAGQLRSERAALAAELVERQFAARPELAARYGPSGREKCLADALHHLTQLADAMDAEEPALFTRYVGWAGVMLGKRGIPAEDLARHLQLTRDVLGERLQRESAVLASAYIDAALAILASVLPEPPTYLRPGLPHAALARQYLDALLLGERQTASWLILEASRAGVTVQDLYLCVFGPVQHEVGRLWQINRISAAQEHYSTAATQQIMSQLYPRIFTAEKNARSMVATCVAGDLHEIGVRMVSDFFELEGWRTFYLGANAPAPAVLALVVERGATVLAISVTMTSHLAAVSELIGRVRAHPACSTVRILVGGYPFTISPSLWRRLGADGTAPDAKSAVAIANRLVGAAAQPT